MKPFENPYERMTMVKNAVFDHIMPRLSGNGWKVLCVAMRQTWGWANGTSPTGRKECDRISYSQFMTKSGIKSRPTVARAIRECLKAHYLTRHQMGTERGRPAWIYALNTSYELDTTGTEIEPVTSIETKPVTGLKTTPTKEIQRNKQNGVGGHEVVDNLSLTTLLELGVRHKEARKLAATCKPHEVATVCEYARTAPGSNNPAGLAVSMLREHEPVPTITRQEHRDKMTACRCGRTEHYLNFCSTCELCPECCKCTREEER